MQPTHLLTTGDTDDQRVRGFRVRLGLIAAVIAFLVVIVGLGLINNRSGDAAPRAAAVGAKPGTGFSITVSYTGGLRPWGDELRQPHPLHVFDSVLYTRTPAPQTYPGPFLFGINERKLTDDQVATLRSNAEAAGLLRSNVEYGTLPVTDIPQTVITVSDGTSTYVSNVFALGLEGDIVPGRDSGVTQQQLADRKKIVAFIDRPFGEQSVEIDRLTASSVATTRLVLAAQAIPDDQIPAASTGERRVAFPVPGLLAKIGTCMELPRAQTTQILPVLEKADSLTYFTDGPQTFQVVGRTLLPGEAGCS
jgi:hypothetical protein